ncbi:hypothetical protein [Mesorhizobium sp.]|uniref:hypothetical protein n=1 Tax=Mesorhizobium sp. TaxID=1871066 RepID=UPI000FE7EBFD|nr:hypothetical protein [Mesorhizobium sp.]RWK12517.1 MAG: hypothetical protein EOR39_02650 [Mesorhizobium sp.]
MTAPIDSRVDPLARKLAPVVREMLLTEVQRIAASIPVARDKARKADDEIMEACRLVARAVDRLSEAKYSQREIAARRELEKTALHLGRAMRRHGRMP